MTQLKRGFASDNNAGIHPQVLEAITRANQGHTIAYGDDPFTQSALAKIKALFRKPVEAHFVFNGTAANVLGLKTMTESYHAVICAETAHINVDECGAPEKFTGCKLLTVPTPDGKLTVDLVRSQIKGIGDQHHVQPKVISIAQTTEMGTVYEPTEISALAEFAHANGMYLHMDGARIANACASLKLPLHDFTQELGVDILSFGGTKNGILAGEAVVFLNPALAKNFLFIRKQGMQLASKMRFIAAQFDALLTDNLWLKSAAHANVMASLLEKEAQDIFKIKITQSVDANAVFAIVPPQIISELKKHYFFYVWNEKTSEVRWMTSFDTTTEDVLDFARTLRSLC